MEAVSARAAAVSGFWAEVLLAAGLAASATAALLAFGPPGGDVAAHLYRTELVREGVFVWDNLWYGGHYPLASYSLLYYLPAAVIGNLPLVVASTVLAAALFAAIAVDQWGDDGRWPARIFAVLAAGPIFMGTYSYAVGLAAALGALRLLQQHRPVLGIVCAALCVGFSPLAFAFLCIVLAAIALAGRRRDRRTFAVAAGVGLVAVLELAVLMGFPSEGRYSFSTTSLVSAVVVSVLGAALASRSARGSILAALFFVWASVCVAGFLVASPFGDNLTRLRAFAFPLVLLAAMLAGFRPRVLAAAALAFALAYTAVPYAVWASKRTDRRTAEEAFWQPAVEFLRAQPLAGYRIEVVPTFDHWEAYWLPREGFALARGWYRQLDIAGNPELYGRLDPITYRSWLRRLGVRYVLLASVRLAPLRADREAELLRSGRAGLTVVRRAGAWTIYEVPHATPILTGPAKASITRLDHARIDGRIAARGSYRLRARYTPYWRVGGPICVRPDRRATAVIARRAGTFRLTVVERPGDVLRAALTQRDGTC